MHVRRSLRAATVAVLLAAGSAGGLLAASPAQAGPTPGAATDSGLPAGFASWNAVFAAQNPLNDAGFQIQAAAAANPHSGYTNFDMDIRQRSINVYWHGRPSTAEQRVIDAVRARGITVRMVAAAHSIQELDAQAAVIERDAGRATGPRVLRVLIATDGSGIQVGVQAVSGPRAVSSPSLAAGLPNLQAQMGRGDVTVVAMHAPSLRFLREDDRPLFWGGALLMASGNSAACSSGFSATWPSIGKTYEITASHCGAIGSNWYSGTGRFIGKAEGHTNAYDALFINTTPQGGSGGHVYDGPGVYSSGQFDKPVDHAAHIGNNGFVCLSGALTGAKCNTQVTSTTDSDCTDANLGCVHLIDAVSRGNPPQVIAGQGDSGGPVFTLTGTNNSRDVAVGLIHGNIPGTSVVSCPNPLSGHISGFSSTRLCATNVSFTDVINAMAPFNGLAIMTG